MILDKLGSTLGKVQTDITTLTGFSEQFSVGLYPLCSPICRWYNGATYTTGQRVDSTNNAPLIWKYKDGVLEYAFVGTIANNDPLTHNHPAIIIDASGFIYLFVVDGHGEPIKIYKSDVAESIVDGWTLHHTIAGIQVGYINLNYRGGVVNIHTRNTGDAPQYSSRLLYSGTNDFTTWTDVNLTESQDGASEQYYGRHYPQNVEHYGTNTWHYFAINARYDRPTAEVYYAHAIIKTQDFATFYNLNETSNYDATVTNISHINLFTDYIVAGSLDTPLSAINGANYIVINDVVYGSYFDRLNDQFKFIRYIGGTQTEYPCNLPIRKGFPTTNINACVFRYNGTNLVLQIRADDGYKIAVCDLNFENQKVVLDLTDSVLGDSIDTAELPINMDEITGDWMLAGGDGFEEAATEGLFKYQILDTVFEIDINETAPNAITDLANTGNSLTWSVPTANTYPIAYYEIYVDGVLSDTSLTNSYNATVDGVEHSYYVKAVNLKGTASEISNIITDTLGYNIPTGNLISFYQLDSDSTDSVGSNNGTDTSISYVSSGGIDNVADFTASTSSRISLGTPADLKFGNGSTDSAFSLSFRVKFSSVASTSVCFDFRKTDNTNKCYSFFLEPGNTRFTFRMFDQSSGGLRDIYYNYSSVSAGVWYDVVITYDGSSTGTMYLNNDSETGLTDSGTYTAMETGTGNVLYIGRLTTGTTASLNGYLDEVAFWDKELTATEAGNIKAQHDLGLSLTA